MPSFTTISDSLKESDILRESRSYDHDRLEPGSLKDLYLRLLKEEAKSEIVGLGKDGPTEKDGQQNPRKRKLSSPPMETVEEAAQYAHLLPQLAKRLYFLYRDEAIKAIETEERKFRSLQKEIRELEVGEKDVREDAPLRKLDTNTRREPRSISSIQSLLRHDEENDRIEGHSKRRPVSSDDPQSSGFPPAAGSSPVESPKIGHPDIYKPRSHPDSTENGSPFPPPPQHPSLGYPSQSSASGGDGRYPSQPHVLPSSGPRMNQTSFVPPERSSASPRIILPPPSGMIQSSGSPTGTPMDAYAGMVGQPYRASTAVASPRQGQYPGSQQHPSQFLPAHQYTQRGYQYFDNQQYSSPHQSFSSQGPLPAYQYTQGFQNHPNPMPYLGHGSPYGHAPLYHSQIPSQTQQPGYYNSPGFYPPHSSQTSRNQASVVSDQHTPISSAPWSRYPKPTPISTSATSTKWKNAQVPGSVRSSRSPIRPSAREISPISDAVPSPEPEASPAQARSTRRQKTTKATKAAPTGPSTRGVTEKTQGTRKRAARIRGGGERASSVTSSARARSRSRSIISHADELSIDTTTIAGRRIKTEPSVTSAYEDDASNTPFTADEGSRKSRRPQRSTLLGLEVSESSQKNTKRKRDEPPTTALPLPSPSTATTTATAPTAKPGHILGTRNFPRTSATVMSDITQHKLASLFGKPLTEREAPGYKSLIARPQDLKSIRAAIVAGSKALTAAADAAGEEVTSNAVWVPETEDVVPPKGIINSAQLEKELTRMFANAVMFNPDIPSNRGLGPAFRTRQQLRESSNVDTSPEAEERKEIGVKAAEGGEVVKDTREMFGAVERAVGEWKAVQMGGMGLRGGRQEEEEVDELAEGEGEKVEESEPKSKRRKR